MSFKIKEVALMLSVLFWLAFGITIGWIAAILQGEKAPKRISFRVMAGVIGGVAGGVGGTLLDPSGTSHFTGTTDIMFAIFGATVLAALAGFVGKPLDHHN